MSYEIRPDGTIIVPDEESAIRISRLLRAEAARTPERPIRPPVPPPPPHVPEVAEASGVVRRIVFGAPEVNASNRAVERAVALLRAVALAGPDGMPSEALAAVLGTSTKGIAPYAYTAKNMLLTRVPQVNKVFWRVKDRAKGTTWYANEEKLKEAGIL